MKKIVVLDGNALLHRAYHATPPMRSSEGVPMNCVYGFVSVLLTIISIERPEYFAVAFDTKAKTFRHEMHDEYKAGRTRPEDDFYVQIPLVKEFLGKFGINVVTCDGYEADDILATISKNAAEKDDIQTVLVTSDRDSFQLITDSCVVHDLCGGYRQATVWNPDEVFVKFGVRPDQFVDFKALMGDKSDNLPGILGIGKKTASRLLQKYETLDGIYENLADLTPKEREKMENGKKDGYFTQEMAQLHYEVPCDLAIESFEFHEPEWDEAKKYLLDMGMHTLPNRIEKLKNGHDIDSMESQGMQYKMSPEMQELHEVLEANKPKKEAMTEKKITQKTGKIKISDEQMGLF